MILLQMLGFQKKMGGIYSHSEGIFGVSMNFGRQFDVIFDNIFPLSRIVLGKSTFLQWSHT